MSVLVFLGIPLAAGQPIAVVRQVRDEIRARVETLTADLLDDH